MDNIYYWFGFLLMGGVIGLLAGLIVKGRGFGIIGDVFVGVVGALLGGYLASVTGLSTSNLIGAFIMALLGAVVLVAVTRYFKRIA